MMIKKLFYTLILICHLATLPAVSAKSGGGAIAGGGGDASESRFDEIRTDIATWIKNGGSKTLELNEIENEEYVSKMSDILLPLKVVVAFVEKDDENNDELKVNVDGVPKTCRGFISTRDSQPHIICNISRFKETDEAAQYRLVHHEYAGLVGIENNDGAASDYTISSQLTNYLSKQTVLKLAVKKITILEKEDPKLNITKSRYIGDDTFEVTISAGNKKDIQQIVLAEGKHTNSPKYQCKVEMPVIELKNENLEHTITLRGSNCNKSYRDFEYDRVLVQYIDGSIKNFGSFRGNYGFKELNEAKNIHLKIETLKDKTFAKQTPRNKIDFVRKEMMFKIGFQVAAEDLANYEGVIFSDGTYFFSNDPNRLADAINLKDFTLEINADQTWYEKEKCSFYCRTKEVVIKDSFTSGSNGPTPYIGLIKKSKLPEIDLFNITEINNLELFYKIDRYDF